MSPKPNPATTLPPGRDARPPTRGIACDLNPPTTAPPRRPGNQPSRPAARADHAARPRPAFHPYLAFCSRSRQPGAGSLTTGGKDGQRAASVRLAPASATHTALRAGTTHPMMPRGRCSITYGAADPDCSACTGAGRETAPALATRARGFYTHQRPAGTAWGPALLSSAGAYAHVTGLHALGSWTNCEKSKTDLWVREKVQVSSKIC